MCIRKLADRLAVLALVGVLLTSTALACGGHCGRNHREVSATSYALCSIENCETVGLHIHDGVTCCGYEHASGFCDGTCVSLCTVEDCQIAERHTHDGVTCCGYAHDSGFCDGTCVAAVSSVSNGCQQRHGWHC